MQHVTGEQFCVIRPAAVKDAAVLADPFSVTLFRLAFVQPRQGDLLTLLDQVRDEMVTEALALLQFSLRPE